MENIKIHKPDDFKGMRIAGSIAAEILDFIIPYVKPGITTDELNTLCHNEIIKLNAIPAPLNYNGYPKSICTSVNHVVCHGIPSNRKLVNGDSLNIDITVIYDGWHGDASRMFYVGEPSIKTKLLVETTYKAMMLGISVVRPGSTFGDIGYIIQNYVEKFGFSVVRDFCGHGIGKAFHMPPSVLHFGKPKTGSVLKPGTFFTIEPMINAGSWPIKVLKDDWTAVTKDRSISAQFEHTVGVTENGVEIFTLSKKGYTYPPYY